MKLATIEKIKQVEKHPNADMLDIVSVLGYQAISKRGQWAIGDLCVFIQPDTCLPEDKEWASFYTAKSKRVKAVRLRGEWSMGIVERIDIIPDRHLYLLEEGLEVSDVLNIVKHEAIIPNNNDAKGVIPYSIPKTDEERYQNLQDEIQKLIASSELVDVTLKIDGQSLTVFVKVEHGVVVDKGICGRTFQFKEGVTNKYTVNNENFRVIEKLEQYCKANNVSIALRGESYGNQIQDSSKNPHAKKNLGVAFFSVYLIDEGKYANKGDKFYYQNVCKELNLPTVDLIEKDVVLTEDLIKKYDSEISQYRGLPFEGVVIKHSKGSFKVINKPYDASNLSI